MAVGVGGGVAVGLGVTVGLGVAVGFGAEEPDELPLGLLELLGLEEDAGFEENAGLSELTGTPPTPGSNPSIPWSTLDDRLEKKSSDSGRSELPCIFQEEAAALETDNGSCISEAGILAEATGKTPISVKLCRNSAVVTHTHNAPRLKISFGRR